MTYVYCLVRSSRKPVVRRGTAGLPGAGPVRALDGGSGTWLLVSDVSEEEYGEAAITAGLKNLEGVSRRAMAHEAVVEQFLQAKALLPMQLFTIFTNDQRALAHVKSDRRRIGGILARVEGHVEWGLRLTWDEQAARAAVEKAHSGTARGPSGSAYLARKRDLLDVNRSQLTGARAEATSLHKGLAKYATDAVRRTATEQAAPGSRLLLDAAYLVPAGSGAAFRRAVKQAARGLRPTGISAALTGPWPPYNFISRS